MSVSAPDLWVPRAPVVVMASGCWDLGPHRGHLNLLYRARQLGDILIVGVLTDDGAAAYKPHRPIQDERTRIENVRNLCDIAVLQESTDPTPLLERYRPDVLCHGSDWDRLLQGQETVERLGIRWVLLPYTPEVSTTILREGRLGSGLQGGLGAVSR